MAGETVPGAQSPTAAPVALVNTDPGARTGPRAARHVHRLQVEGSLRAAGRRAEPTPVASPGARSPAKPKPTAKGFKGKAVTAGKTTIVSVNGNRHVLEPGSTFPPANPVFVLVSEQPKAKTVVIGLPSGKYADGAGKRRLRAGTPLVLVNTASGKRYTPHARGRRRRQARDRQEPLARHGVLQLQRDQLARRRVDGRAHRHGRRLGARSPPPARPAPDLARAGRARPARPSAARRSSRGRSRSSRASSRR